MSDMMVLKRQCERCPAIEEVPVSAEDIKSGKYKPPADDGTPKYQIVVNGTVMVSYKRLCNACDDAVAKMIGDIGKKREKKSSKRT